MLILIATHKDSLCRALRFEFDSIQDSDRLKEIFYTTKELGFDEEAAEMHRELVIEGIMESYTF